MKIEKCVKRDRKRSKRKYGMRRDGDSVKNIQRLYRKKRDLLLKKLRDEKEQVLIGGTNE